MVLGIADPWIWGSYILCILATLLCVVYGILNWNKGDEEETAWFSFTFFIKRYIKRYLYQRILQFFIFNPSAISNPPIILYAFFWYVHYSLFSTLATIQ